MNKWLVLLVLLIFLALFLLVPHSASGATLVQELNWRDAAGRLIDGGCVITPIGEFVAPNTWRIAGVPVAYIIARGLFSASLIPTDTATPSGQYYTVSCVINKVTRPPTIWLVPTTGATLAVKDVEATALPPLSTVQWSQLVNIGVSLGAGTYSAYMPNPTYPPAYVIASGSSGDLDLYTVPANRRALLLGWTETNASGGNITAYLETKIAGSYYRLTAAFPATQNIDRGVNMASNLNVPPRVLNAGETASINMSATGLSTWLHLVEFDATSPLRSVTLTTFNAGDNTLYTVPAGKTFEVLPPFGTTTDVRLDLRPSPYYSNGSGGSRNVTIYAVPSGGSTAASNTIYSSGGAFLSNTTVTLAGSFYGSLAPGDFIDVNVDSNAPGQMAWMNIIEH